MFFEELLLFFLVDLFIGKFLMWVMLELIVENYLRLMWIVRR